MDTTQILPKISLYAKKYYSRKLCTLIKKTRERRCSLKLKKIVCYGLSHVTFQMLFLLNFNDISRIVCEIQYSSLKIPRSFEQVFERQALLFASNIRTIFECDILSSDSVAKSATQKLGFSETSDSFSFSVTGAYIL